MKVDFKFHNLCGTVYRKGNVVFTTDGNSILSPVGNRVTCFDLKNNKSYTLPVENGTNITRLCLSPNNDLLLTVDQRGKCILFSLKTNAKLHYFSFKQKVYDIKYSPNGKFIAVTHGRGIRIWHAPGTTKEFSPLTLIRTSVGAYDDVTSIDWSSDSKFIIAGGKDMSSRIYSVHKMKHFKPYVLTGHRNVIVNCFFMQNSLNCYTVSKDGALFSWKCDKELEKFELVDLKRRHESENEEKESNDKEEFAEWMLDQKHFFNQDNTSLTTCQYHKLLKLLVVGFSSGIFMLYEMPEFIQIHSLSISQHKINTIAINCTGDWLGFGSASLGQLLVWEWRSETYVLKQQGHFYDMNVMAYSQDGQFVATGGDDGKVKLWNTISGFCFVTFNEHNGGVTGVEFSQNGQVVVSASMDGTCRAFDLNRYRNFRTFTAPRPCQFSCLALDASGEIICAGSLDTFEIFMWSMQTGRLLDVLAGHEGPVSCLSFNPVQAILVSGSWDDTCRLWDVYNHNSPKETIQIGSNVTSVAYRPDGHEIAISALDGEIKFWQPSISLQIGSIEGRKDLGGGRRKTDMVTAKHLMGSKCFTSLSYSADGQCILAGGRSKYVCIYNIEQQILLRRFEISCNKSLDGMQRKLNSRNMTEGGALDLMDLENPSDGDEENMNIRLPGVQKGDMSSRRVQPEIQTKCLKFSPTGRAWAAATTEGLLIFSLDGSLTFRPEFLDIDVTPERILEFIAEKNHTQALSYSFRLNEHDYILRAIENIPIEDIPLLARNIPNYYLEKLLQFVAKQLETSQHLQYYLTWTKTILTSHGSYIKNNSRTLMPMLRMFQKSLARYSDSLSTLCDNNSYSLMYLLSTKAKPNNNESEGDELVELMDAE